MQGPLHGLVALHVPTQAGNKLAGVRSCRAETVPAQRTAAAIAASSVFLIVLLIIHSPFSVRLMRAFACCYFPEGATPASFVVQNAVVGVVKEQTHLELVEIQGRVALQVPPQVDPWTPFRNCRAETVPAHRTATAMTANDRFWIFFFMDSISFRL
jgi:hypothetical protein